MKTSRAVIENFCNSRKRNHQQVTPDHNAHTLINYTTTQKKCFVNKTRYFTLFCYAIKKFFLNIEGIFKTNGIIITPILTKQKH